MIMRNMIQRWLDRNLKNISLRRPELLRLVATYENSTEQDKEAAILQINNLFALFTRQSLLQLRLPTDIIHLQKLRRRWIVVN